MTSSHLGAHPDVVRRLEEIGFPIDAYEGLDEPLLTTGQVAVVLRATDRTVRTYADAGKIRSIRTLGGRRLFPLSAVLAAMELMFGRRLHDGDGGEVEPS